jgi:hypothetical protein
MTDAITIRHSREEDRVPIARLAALDDRPVPRGQVLLAFVEGELRAALPLGRGELVADPFHLTQQIVDLLRFRAGQELEAGERRPDPAGGARLHIHARTTEAAA